MTQLEKAQFFAQYYGQKVQRWHQWTPDVENGIVHMITPQASGSCAVDSGWFLELTRLEDITDEDAIEVAKICEFSFGNLEDDDFKEVGQIRDWIVNIFYIEFNYTTSHVLFAADFLRSKSYLLPWLNYTVEQLIEEGVVKIKND